MCDVLSITGVDAQLRFFLRHCFPISKYLIHWFNNYLLIFGFFPLVTFHRIVLNRKLSCEMVSLPVSNTIPLRPDEVSQEWLTTVLQGSGFLEEDSIVSCSKELIGEGAGFLGQIFRITLQTGNGNADPASLILKIPTTTINRKIGQLIGVYEREIRFYQELQPLLHIRTPRHYYSAMDASDPETAVKGLRFMKRLPIRVAGLLISIMGRLPVTREHRYVLLLEDLGHFRIGDQVEGCSMDEARLALDTMAGLHADFFNRALDRFPWVIPIDLGARITQILAAGATSQFREEHAPVLAREHVGLIDWLEGHADDLLSLVAKLPYTLLHGDYRLDNLFFDDARGELIVFDWQTLLQGPVGIDLAYFLSASIDDDDIDLLLSHYRQSLLKRGVEFSPERIRFEYEVGLLCTISRLIFMSAQEFAFGEGRGLDLQRTWLNRIMRQSEGIDPDRLMQTIPD